MHDHNPYFDDIDNEIEEPTISLTDNINLYLKPDIKGKSTIHLLMLLLDSCVCMMFFSLMVYHIFTDKFKSLNEKVIESLIGVGVSAFALIYCYIDGIQYLESNIDRIIFFISCSVFQKPILLPVIFKGRFKSKAASIDIAE